MMNLKAGDLIKSYDFSKELQAGCYMVGLIEEITENSISCKMVKSFFEGKAYDHASEEFSTVPQGMGFFDDRNTRIELIATAEEVALVLSEYAVSH